MSQGTDVYVVRSGQDENGESLFRLVVGPTVFGPNVGIVEHYRSDRPIPLGESACDETRMQIDFALASFRKSCELLPVEAA